MTPARSYRHLVLADTVRDGKIPAGYTWLGYDQGKMPASSLIAAVPFGMEPMEYVAWHIRRYGARDTFRNLSDRLFFLIGLATIFKFEAIATWLPSRAY